MKKTTSILLASSIALITGCATNEVQNSHWGYTGHNTPDTWGQLSKKYAECGIGVNQSPINITHSLHAHLPPLAPHYTSSSKNIIDNGHTVQVNMEAGSTFKIDGKTFELKQFHFHSPSENQIDGKSFPLEAHFVNLDKDGNIAVIAVMFNEGKANKALEKVWAKMPQKEGETHILNLASIANAILPKNKHYYRFNGSLTTPPCTEGVRWFVLKSPVTVSKEQVEKFHHLMHHNNNRPIQPLDARAVID